MPKYCHQYWEELPESAKAAAAVLQYTGESWDADEEVPFDTKSFAELTLNEKKAAMFLGIEFIEKKNQTWWEDTDEEIQKHAQVLGWDQEKWDDNWHIHHLDCEHWWWEDMDEEQRLRRGENIDLDLSADIYDSKMVVGTPASPRSSQNARPRRRSSTLPPERGSTQDPTLSARPAGTARDMERKGSMVSGSRCTKS